MVLINLNEKTKTAPIVYFFPFSEEERKSLNKQAKKLLEIIENNLISEKELNSYAEKDLILKLLERKKNKKYLTDKQLMVLHSTYLRHWFQTVNSAYIKRKRIFLEDVERLIKIQYWKTKNET